jgi:hypothetical protein
VIAAPLAGTRTCAGVPNEALDLLLVHAVELDGELLLTCHDVSPPCLVISHDILLVHRHSF